MLDESTEKIGTAAKPNIHTDRESHYRWPGWIKRMHTNGWIRLMSKKGCSPDNSACEGLFGRLKNEFFYCRAWMGTSLDEFIRELDEYLQRYNKDRANGPLGFKSPIGYRVSLGITI